MKSILEPKPVRVVEVIDEAIDTKTYYVELNKTEELPKPGQFYMVYAWGFGEIPISVSDILLGENKTLVGLTIRSAGSVSRFICENIAPGSVIGMRGPYGREWPIDKYIGWRIVVIAGGIGLAPLRPLVKHVLLNIDKYESLEILYGARSSKHIIYRKELSEWSKLSRVKLYLTIDKPEPGWSGLTGFVTEYVDQVKPGEKTVVFICGPEIMMRISIDKLVKLGFKPDNIYLSLERRMRCGVGVCGTCQLGPLFVCLDGPVFKYSDLDKYFWIDGI